MESKTESQIYIEHRKNLLNYKSLDDLNKKIDESSKIKYIKLSDHEAFVEELKKYFQEKFDEWNDKTTRNELDIEFKDGRLFAYSEILDKLGGVSP